MKLRCRIFGHQVKFNKDCLYCPRCVKVFKFFNEQEPPALTAEQFIEKFRRNYCNYAALIEVAFVGTPEMDDEYERLSDQDRKKVVEYAREHAAKAL